MCGVHFGGEVGDSAHNFVFELVNPAKDLGVLVLGVQFIRYAICGSGQKVNGGNRRVVVHQFRLIGNTRSPRKTIKSRKGPKRAGAGHAGKKNPARDRAANTQNRIGRIFIIPALAYYVPFWSSGSHLSMSRCARRCNSTFSRWRAPQPLRAKKKPAAAHHCHTTYFSASGESQPFHCKAV